MIKNLYLNKFFQNKWRIIVSLILFKTAFEIIIIKSGLRWLTADDYSRTVISWGWLQHPAIFSGVWLSLHFWLNGLFIALIGDLTSAPIVANTIFSILTLIYFYLLVDKLFGKKIAIISCLIFSVFPFQVWLSASGMPESIFFFFITAAVYYFIRWYEISGNDTAPRSSQMLYTFLCVLFLNFASLLRYEGWLFSITFIIFVSVISFQKFKNKRQFFINSGISFLSLLAALWWLLLNLIDFGDAFFFIKETTRIFKDIANAGLVQRVVQYPFFIFYIAPLTTILALWKIYKTLRMSDRTDNKNSGTEVLANKELVKILLLFNLAELFLLMITGIFGSGGTNMVSRYIVMNAIFLFPFAAWQLIDFRKYIAFASIAALLLINIVWSFYYQQAYREDTYEVANLTKKLIQKNYFEADDRIYFESAEGYYDMYPLQVSSNKPSIFVSDTIPAYFPANVPSKKFSKKKQEDEQQKLSILELRKFLEKKKIKLCIVRSDMLVDKLKKLSYKSEQIGDYHIFYLAENKIKPVVSGIVRTKGQDPLSDNIISFDRKLVLKNFYIDNTNLGLNPQTVTVKWEIADGTILDSLFSADDEFGRYYIKVELSVPGKDSAVYETYSPIFSERIVEDFFETEEIKNIVILKPFAMLNYTFPKGRFPLVPFESGVYDIHLSVLDKILNNELRIYKGDSIYIPEPEEIVQDTSISITTRGRDPLFEKSKKKKEEYLRRPYYTLGRIIAVFPNANYASVLKKSKDFSQIMLRNALMLPFLQRYQGDHFLNIVFTYF